MSWMTPTPIDSFPWCDFYYGYLINDEFAGEVSGNSILLSDLNITTLCNQTILTLYPVVMAQNMALTNLNSSGTTCYGEYSNYKEHYNIVKSLLMV